MIHLWPISAGLCLEIPKPAPSLISGAPRIQSHLPWAENLAPTIQGMVFQNYSGSYADLLLGGTESGWLVGTWGGQSVCSQV